MADPRRLLFLGGPTQQCGFWKQMHAAHTTCAAFDHDVPDGKIYTG